jgi:hypothetical protein
MDMRCSLERHSAGWFHVEGNGNVSRLEAELLLNYISAILYAELNDEQLTNKLYKDGLDYSPAPHLSRFRTDWKYISFGNFVGLHGNELHIATQDTTAQKDAEVYSCFGRRSNHRS